MSDEIDPIFGPAGVTLLDYRPPETPEPSELPPAGWMTKLVGRIFYRLGWFVGFFVRKP